MMPPTPLQSEFLTLLYMGGFLENTSSTKAHLDQFLIRKMVKSCFVTTGISCRCVLLAV